MLADLASAESDAAITQHSACHGQPEKMAKIEIG
jgi:hypothetical protein